MRVLPKVIGLGIYRYLCGYYMFKLVPTIQTIYSQEDLCKGLVQVWLDVFNKIPSKESIGILIAQNGIETGGKYFWNNNLGNVKVGADSANSVIEYMMLRDVWEIINGRKVIFQPPHRATWFRSFPTLNDGIKFHLDILKNQRYAEAWVAVERGDLAQFAHLLKMKGYYTAPEQDYLNGMLRHYNAYYASKNYEKACVIFKPSPIPLPPGPPVVVPPGPPVITPNDDMQLESVPNEDIERKSTFALMIQTFLEIIASWFKPKS